MIPTVQYHAPAVLPAVDLDRVAHCIRLVENRRNKRRGAHGEVGPDQWTFGAWQEETDAPFSLANDAAFSRRIVLKRLRRIQGLLLARGMEVSAYSLACAWNGGISSVILHKWCNKDVQDYSIRVENLYLDR